jgi:hypothetical protein
LFEEARLSFSPPCANPKQGRIHYMCTQTEREEIVDFIATRTGKGTYYVSWTIQRTVLLLESLMRQGKLLLRRDKIIEIIGEKLCLSADFPTPVDLVKQIVDD